MNNRFLRLEININSSHPELLTGLEVWLNLGLISDSQVKKISRMYLSCPLPESIRVIPIERIRESEGVVMSNMASAIPAKVASSVTKKSSILTQFFQSFKEELSVRWLLFLGLFLVILSSAVLAATQWERFPESGQYGILFLYTLVFWGVGFWANKQENLRLTAQTLQVIFLLLIPVNFWAMDTFQLWSNLGGILISLVASIFLTSIAYLYRQQDSNLLLFWEFIGLSYLHSGWHFSPVPLIAVYLATITTAILLKILPNLSLESSANSLQITIGKRLIIYSLLILLMRGVFVANIPIQQLGLAMGICGWLMQRQRLNSQSLEGIGIFSLFIGWLVSAGEEIPWQATIISGLATHFFFNRLKQNWLRRDLLAIFIIGFQGLFLIREFIPLPVRQSVMNYSIQIAHSEAFPQSVYGLFLFPYLLIFVGITEWLYNQSKLNLARFGEYLTLGLGTVLTLLAISNPTWQFLNLLLSTATLFYTNFRYSPIRIWLIYFTHLIGLLTIFSLINLYFPTLSPLNWAIILLGLMIVEWGCSLLHKSTNELSLKDSWYLSSWHFGFILAFLSYGLLWHHFELFFHIGEIQLEMLFWLLTPLCLTGMAVFGINSRKIQSATWSCITLVIAQSLTCWQPETRIISLALAAGLMLINCYYIDNLTIPLLQIGFTLTLVFVWLQQTINLSIENWYLLAAIIMIILWSLHNLCKKQSIKVTKQQYKLVFNLYANATKIWANILEFSLIAILSYRFLYSFFYPPSYQWQYLAISTLIGGIIIYHDWQNPDNITVYRLGMLLEIFLVETIGLLKGSYLSLAIGNLSLAFLILLITNFWLSKRLRLSQLISLSLLPLFYAILSIIYRLGHFTAYTGLLSLGVSLIGIFVASRLNNGKPLAYFSLAGISFSVYELVIYQMLQASENNPADGLIILTLIPASIALIYRLFAWIFSLNRLSAILNLSLKEIIITANIHWAIASLIKLLTIIIAINNKPQLTILSMTIYIILSFYALIQGRNKETNTSDWWVYVGLIEIASTVIYARLIWTELSILDSWKVVIASLVSLAIYQVSWSNLGWKTTPWHRAALIIPALTTLVTIKEISELSLLVVAAFYGRVALREKNIRLTYISLGFIDWAILQILYKQPGRDILFYAILLGLSVLYIAQVDPILQRSERHSLRILGSGMIGLTALLFHRNPGIIPLVISLVISLAGLGLQIRAFLFVGTITFMLTVAYQLIILIVEYAFLKWIIGLMLGIVLIIVAANFERRRNQMITVWQDWQEEFNHWE